MKIVIKSLLLILFCAAFAAAQSRTRTGPPKYTGTPETDKAFAQFITANLGRVVHLDLTINGTAWITDGYRGEQSMIYGAKLRGIDYSYFLECDQVPDAETAIAKCGSLVSWNEDTGKLSGRFRVVRIVRTGVRNYRAVFLAPVRR